MAAQEQLSKSNNTFMIRHTVVFKLKHPDHVAFVQTYWINEVSEFLEIDYEPYK